MANFVFNPAKGTLVQRWRTLGPDYCSIWLIPVAVNGVSDDALRNAATLPEYLALGPTELTTDGWGRREFNPVSLVDAQLDEGNNRMGLVVPQGLWEAVAESAPAATDLLICHNLLSNAGATDPTMVPLTQHDFTPVLTGGNVELNFGYFHYAA